MGDVIGPFGPVEISQLVMAERIGVPPSTEPPKVRPAAEAGVYCH